MKPMWCGVSLKKYLKMVFNMKINNKNTEYCSCGEYKPTHITKNIKIENCRNCGFLPNTKNKNLLKNFLSFIKNL